MCFKKQLLEVFLVARRLLQQVCTRVILELFKYIPTSSREKRGRYKRILRKILKDEIHIEAVLLTIREGALIEQEKWSTD